jgi:hypothetical protein
LCFRILSIENLSGVEYALSGRQSGLDEKLNVLLCFSDVTLSPLEPLADRIATQDVVFWDKSLANSALIIVDLWTLLMAAFVVVQVVLTLVMWQVRKPDRGDVDKTAGFMA